MPDARYFLPDHPSLKDTYAKDDLRRLVQAGRLSRSEMVFDDETGLAHLLGDLLAAPYHGTAPPGRSAGAFAPASGAIEEFRAPTPLPEEKVHPQHHEPDEAFHDDEPEDFENPGPADDEAPPEPPVPSGQTAPPHHVASRVETPPQAAPQPAGRGAAEGAAEEFFYRGRPSWFSYPKSLVTVAAFITAAILCHYFDAGFLWTGLCAAFAALVILFVMLGRTTTEYVVTSRRVEIESGLVGRNTKEIRISDIRAIDVTQGGWNAFVGVGTVEFFSAAGGEADVVFANVWRPHRVKECVRELQL